LAIDGVGAFELLGRYEVGALVGLRGPIIGRGNVELGDVISSSTRGVAELSCRVLLLTYYGA